MVTLRHGMILQEGLSVGLQVLDNPHSRDEGHRVLEVFFHCLLTWICFKVMALRILPWSITIKKPPFKGENIWISRTFSKHLIVSKSIFFISSHSAIRLDFQTLLVLGIFFERKTCVFPYLQINDEGIDWGLLCRPHIRFTQRDP